jgi:hypothetical protein
MSRFAAALLVLSSTAFGCADVLPSSVAVGAPASYSNDEEAVLRHISEARTAQGLQPPTRATRPPEMQRIAARVSRDEEVPYDALRDMMSNISWGFDARARGYVFETNDPANIELPEIFFRRPLTVVVTITPFPPRGGVRGRYAVFVVLPEPRGTWEN